MTFPHQKFREIVFQLLYSKDFSGTLDEGSIFLIMERLAVTKKIVKMAFEKQELVWEKLEILDALIAEASLEYTFDRIPHTERNILRLGVFELLYDDAIPAKVAIAEAIRLSRKFATHEASSFVNALLDALYATRFPEKQISQ